MAHWIAASCLLGVAVGIDAQPDSRFRRVDRPALGRYIVVLRQTEDSLTAGAEMARLNGGHLRHVYRAAINGFAADLSESAAQKLARDFRVLYVEQDGVVSAASDVQQAPAWGLDRIDQRSRPLDGLYEFARSGHGVNVYVVDSGIRVSHAEFGGRAFIAGDYADDDDGRDDCFGHGTHVAGIVGGATYGVARNVTLWSQRVLNCRGLGATSAVIAAVDAMTADTTRRPAVAVIGLTAPASKALDAAIRQSIASGVTYVAAAGNEGRDASFNSPARVIDAISVGATTSNDARAGFSNFGPSVDLFAPGVAIPSAAISNDSPVAAASGTSAAAAHVAGVAALYLETRVDASPSEVETALIENSTSGVVKNTGPGSPNRLLHSPPDEWVSDELSVAGSTTMAAGSPVLTVTSPTTAVNWGVGSKRRISWTHNIGIKKYVRIEVSRDGGTTYSVIAASVKNASASVGSYTWTVTGPNTSAARIRVTSTDGAVSDVSDQPFTIASPFVRLTTPNGGDTWTTGTSGTMTWVDNLGSLESVALRLSLNGGLSYSIVLRSSTPSDGASSVPVSSAWLTALARVQVSWVTNTAIKDASDNVFGIGSTPANQPPTVGLTGPVNGATYTAPATITIDATASDADGTITRVDFYRGATLIGSDTTSPYSVTWTNAQAGSYSLTARAIDDDGATTSSAAHSVTVTTASGSWAAIFAPSLDHDTLVTSYVFEVFAEGAIPGVDLPLATQNLGKPSVVNGECTADISATISALAPGTYMVITSAVGVGGSTRGAPITYIR